MRNWSAKAKPMQSGPLESSLADSSNLQGGYASDSISEVNEQHEPMQSLADAVPFFSDSSEYSNSDFETMDEAKDEQTNMGHCDSLALAVVLKRRQLEIPYRKSREETRQRRIEGQEMALKDVQQMLASKKSLFDCGNNALQARRTQAIEAQWSASIGEEFRMKCRWEVQTENEDNMEQRSETHIWS